MSLFKQVSNWSDYHDRQLKVLESIEKSFVSSLRISRSVEDSLSRTKSFMDSMVNSSKIIAESMSSIANERNKNKSATDSFTSSIESLNRAAKDHILVYERYNGVIDHTARKQEEAARAADDLIRAMEEEEEARRKAKEREEKDAAARKEAVDYTLGQLQKYAEQFGKIADNYSSVSNYLIQLSGSTGAEVRNFRSEFVGIVSDLNSRTGNAYNPLKSYELIVSTSKGITSNLEALREMSEPLLLAQESLNIDIGSVADIFNRFYTRYNFSSSHMEDALDHIRKNTAGNSANEAEIAENISALENWIGFTAKNDNKKRDEMLESITNYSSWLGSMGMNSKPFTEYLNAIAYGDYSAHPELANILSRGGVSSLEATNMAQDGKFEELTRIMMNGIYSVFDTVDDSAALGASLDNLGISRDLAMDVWNVKNSSGYVGLDEFIKGNKNNPTMEDGVEDKYISATQQLQNWRDTLLEKVAGIQEFLGFGLSDIAGLYVLFKGFRAGWDKLSGFGKSGGSTPISPSSPGRLATGLAKGGSALSGGAASGGLATGIGVAGLLGGAAMIGGGINIAADTAENWQDSSTTDKAVGIATAGGAIAGGGMLGAAALGLASGPVGWIGLAIGGAALLGKTWYDEANSLAGNAAKVEEEIKSIEAGLKQENKERMASINDLNYAFSTAKDIEEKRKLLEESGIIDLEELRNTSNDNLGKLLQSYTNAAAGMDTVTDSVLKLAESIYKEEQNTQQKGFIDQLLTKSKNGEFSEEQMTDIINILKGGVTHEGTLGKIKEHLASGGKITQDEFDDILTGGWDNWWDKNNIHDVGLNVSAMQSVANSLGWDTTYLTNKNMTQATQLAQALMSAIDGVDKTNKLANGKYAGAAALTAAKKAIEDSGIKDEVYRIFGDQIDSKARMEGINLTEYALGTNYITRDHIALLHEGEAVVPKKYNPAVNSAEFRMLAEELKNNQQENKVDTKEYRINLNALIDEVRELRAFLAEWKDSNITRENISEIRNRHSTNRAFIQQYLSI